MSPTTSTVRRRRTLTGIMLAAGLALGTAVVASGASRHAGPVPSPVSSSAGTSVAAGCAAIGPAMATATVVASAGGTVGAVDTTRQQAASVATGTASDDLREAAQNLADDLAAYRVALSQSPQGPSTRRTDIAAAVHGDLAALRRICGR
jgi:hypothetical protein